MSIRATCRFIVACLVKLFYHHKTYGAKRLKGVRAAIIAPNHSSYLDPPLVGVSAPFPVHFLAKSSLFDKPFYKWFFAKLYTHPLERGRGNAATFKKALSFLESGEKLVIFPEGKRSDTPELEKGEIGVALLVWMARCPVIPVYVHGTYDIWNIHMKQPKLRGRTACVFGSKLSFEPLFERDKREALPLIVDQIMERIAALKAWYLAGAKGEPP
jgi:1-acyl-sn-glycerol-3-phosphate acyltransferase